MKKILIFLSIIVVFSLTAESQSQSRYVESSSSIGIAPGDKAIDETITVDGKHFQLYETKNKNRYIKCLSAKKGNHYAVWIGTLTGDHFDQRPVRKTSTGKPFVLKISEKSGNPYNVWLDEQNE